MGSRARVRVRHHVNPEKVEFHFPSVPRVALPPAGEVEVELGCAEAQFLFERAEQAAAERVASARLHVGVEIRRELVPVVNRRAEERGLPVQAVFGHANIHFAQLFAPASLARVFVNFPDPWFKMRHRKRRVMDPELVTDIAATLRPHGELFVQTDIFDLSLDAMAAIEESGRFTNEAGPWSYWKRPNPYAVRSRREEQCEALGRPIWRLWYRRN
jgi:tRNA (guanine-N7-)-methyltransferase